MFVAVSVGVFDGVSVGVSVGVSDGVGVKVSVGVLVGVSVTVGVNVSVGVKVAVGVSVGVLVGGTGVSVGVLVEVLVGVFVADVVVSKSISSKYILIAVAVDGAASNRISANAAVAGEVAEPVTCTQEPLTLLTKLESLVDNCEPPEQFALVYHATRIRALPKFDVPVGTRIYPDQLYDVLELTGILTPPQLPPPPIPLDVVELFVVIFAEYEPA